MDLMRVEDPGPPKEDAPPYFDAAAAASAPPAPAEGTARVRPSRAFPSLREQRLTAEGEALYSLVAADDGGGGGPNDAVTVHMLEEEVAAKMKGLTLGFCDEDRRQWRREIEREEERRGLQRRKELEEMAMQDRRTKERMEEEEQRRLAEIKAEEERKDTAELEELEAALMARERRLADKTAALAAEADAVLATGAALEPKHNLRVLLLGDSDVGKTSLLHRLRRTGFVEGSEPTANPYMAAKCIEVDGETVRLEVWDFPGRRRSALLGRATRAITARAVVVCNCPLPPSAALLRTLKLGQYVGAGYVTAAALVFDVTRQVLQLTAMVGATVPATCCQATQATPRLQETLDSLEYWKVMVAAACAGSGDATPVLVIGNKTDQDAARQVSTRAATTWCAQQSAHSAPITYCGASARDDTNVEAAFAWLVRHWLRPQPLPSEAVGISGASPRRPMTPPAAHSKAAGVSGGNDVEMLDWQGEAFLIYPSGAVNEAHPRQPLIDSLSEDERGQFLRKDAEGQERMLDQIEEIRALKGYSSSLAATNLFKTPDPWVEHNV